MKSNKRICIFVIDLLQFECADNEDFYNLLAPSRLFIWGVKKKN